MSFGQRMARMTDAERRAMIEDWNNDDNAGAGEEQQQADADGNQ